MPANLSVTRATNPFQDRNGNGIQDPGEPSYGGGEVGAIDPGDVLYTRVTITNTGDTVLTAVTFSDSFTGTTLISGSVNVSPIAFNDAFTAVGNTVLRVGGAANIGSGPSSTVVGNLLSNDVGSSSIGVGAIAGDDFAGFDIVTVSDGTSAGGGTFNIFADGSFNYVNQAGDTGTDTFTYTIRDRGYDGIAGNADDLLSTATVTITLTGEVWYVDSTGSALGTGTSNNPFNSITALNTANLDGIGDTIYVRNTPTGAIVLENGQQLVGQGADLSVASFTLATAGANSTISANVTNGWVVTVGQNNTIAGLNILGNGTNTGGITDNQAGSFGTLSLNPSALNAATPGYQSTITASGAALSLSDGAVAGNGFSNTSSSGGASNVSLTNITGTLALGTGAMTNATGASFNVVGGTVSTNYAGGITHSAATGSLLNVSGGHATGTLSFTTGTLSSSDGGGLVFNDADGNYTLSGTTTINGGTSGLAITNGSAGSFTIGGTASIGQTTSVNGVAVTVADSSAALNFDMDVKQTNNFAILDVTNHSGGTFTFQTTASLDATNGSGIQFTNADATYTMSSANTLHGGDAGIDIDGDSTGTFAFISNTVITSPTGTAFNVANSNANITYGGSITQANNAALLAVTDHASGTISFNAPGILNATNGTGLQFSNADATYNFNGTVTLNGGDAGIDITSGSNGAFTFGSSVSLTNASGTNFNVNGGAGNITFNGVIDDDNGQLIAITGRTGGTIDFNGLVTDKFDGDGGGVAITNNSGGTTRFDGGLLLSTGASNALTVTNTVAGSTIVITDPAGAGNNKLETTSGTALNVTNVNIGAEDLTFESISSAGGSANGIILNNTGSAGGLHVTGTGSAGTGGTISGKTGADGNDSTVGTGIYLSNTADVQLASMNVHSNANFGIRGLNVNGFQLSGSNIGGGGTNGSSAAFDEGSIAFGTLNVTNGLTGTASITNTTIHNGFENGMSVFNNAGTLNLTMSGLNVSGSANGDGIVTGVKGSGTLNVSINGSTFTNNRGDHYNASADGAANLAVLFGNTSSNTLSGTAADTNLGQGIAIQTGVGWSGTGSANISNNVITFAKDTPINVNVGGTGTFGATIVNNTIGNGTLDSGTEGNKDAIRLIANGDGANTAGGTLNALVQGNVIRNVDGRGIVVLGRDGGSAGDPIRINVTIIGNTLRDSPNAQGNGIRVEAGAVTPDYVDIFADIGGTGGRQNTFIGDWGVSAALNSSDIRIIHDKSDGGPTVYNHVKLTDYFGSPTSSPDVVAYLTARNTLGGGAVSATLLNPPNTWGTGGTPPQPIMAAEFAPLPVAEHDLPIEGRLGTENLIFVEPSAPPTGSEGGSGSETEGSSAPTGAVPPPPPPPPPATPPVVVVDDGILSEGELALIVDAAIARWAAAGATPAQLAAMRATDISVSNLGGLQLGESGLGAITLDDDAGGWRWFVDATPGEDGEYRGSGSQLLARDDQPIAGTRIDLLTVVMHELGHQIGLADSHAPGDHDVLMFGTVRAGERRLPGAEDVASGTGPAVIGAFAVSPINLGTLNPGMSATIEFRSTVDTFGEDQLAPRLVGRAQATSGALTVFSATETMAVDGLTLGNRIFLDANGDGMFISGDGDTGAPAGITLSLFADTNNSGSYEEGTDLAVVFEDVNNNGVYDAGDAPRPAGSSGTGPNGGPTVAVTATTDASGFYSFANLAPGDYIVRVDAGNFGAGTLGSRRAHDAPADPNNNVDNDNNGEQFLPGLAGTYAASRAIRLDYGLETVAGPTGPDADTNDTLDLGFELPNQPPVIANVQGNSVTFTEGDAAVNVDALGDAAVSDSDSTNYNGGSLTVSITGGKVAAEDQLWVDGTVSISGGIVSIGVTPIGTVTGGGAGGSDLVFSFNTTDADDARVQTLIRAITYSNSDSVAPTGGARTVSLTLVDGGGEDSGGDDDTTVTSTVNVVSVNDAPAGTDTSPYVLISEDQVYTFSVADFGFSDTDGHLFAGIVLTTAPGVGTVRANGSVVGSGGFITEAHITAGLVTYTPNANLSGAPFDSFTFQVRDTGGTTPGQDTDQSANTFGFNVSAVNDAPLNGVPPTQMFNEDGTRTFSVANGNAISVSDVDVGAGNLRVTLAIETGTLTLSGTTDLSFSLGDGTGDTTMTFTGTAAAINAALDGLVYNPGVNFNGDRNLVITTNDLGNSGADPGGADLTSEQDQDTILIDVVSVNDAPVVIGGTTIAATAILEDTPVAHTVNDLFASHYSDAADAQYHLTNNPGGSSPGSFTGIAVVANVTGSGSGEWQYLNGASVWTDIGTVSASSAMLIANSTQIRFNPAPNFNGAAPDLTVRLIDNSLGFGIVSGDLEDASTVGGSSAYSADAILLSQSVTAVNDAPVNSAGGAVSINEDTAVILSDNVSPMSVADVEATANISYNLLVEHGTLTIRTDIVGGIQASDIQTGPGLGNGTGSLVITATQAEINLTLASANGLIYTPTPHYHGSDTLSVYVNDGGQSGMDPNPVSILDPDVEPDVGPVTEEDLDTRAITIASINDAPVLSAPTSATITFTEGDSSIALMQGVTLSDADLPANFAGGSLNLTVSGGPGSGGVNLRAGSAFQIVDIGGGNFTIVYTPGGPLTIGAITGYGTPTMAITGLTSDATLARLNDLVDDFVYVIVGENPTASVRTVTLTFNDGGNTGGGGALNGVVNQTLNVVAVNDAPVITAPLTRAGTEDTNLVFSTANGNPVSVADVDATILSVTLTVLHGRLTLAGTAGLSFFGGSNGSSTMTFEGTASAINTALDGLVYRGALNYEGSDTLSISADDKGATGTPGTQFDSHNIAISLADDGLINGDDNNNDIDGTPGNDIFFVRQLGSDRWEGLAGNDAFLFGAFLDATDYVDGGTGDRDELAIQGNYGTFGIGGLPFVFGPDNLRNIEVLVPMPGFDARFGDPGTNLYDYHLKTVDANVAAGTRLIVDFARLQPGEDMIFDGSAELDGAFTFGGGRGVDILTGGTGADLFIFRSGGRYGAGDIVNGGLGNDELSLRGSYTLTLQANAMTSIEVLALLSGQNTRFGPIEGAFHYDITTHQNNVAVGQRLVVDAGQLMGNETLRFDGSNETDGGFFWIGGGLGDDILIGGSANDLLIGGGGKDSLKGGAGADVYRVRSVGESASTGYDVIDGFVFGSDTLDLTGTHDSYQKLSSGSLSSASFDADLDAALDPLLTADLAIFFSPTAGTLAGKTFLVVDGNGVAGYQAGADFVFELINSSVPVVVPDFIV